MEQQQRIAHLKGHIATLSANNSKTSATTVHQQPLQTVPIENVSRVVTTLRKLTYADHCLCARETGWYWNRSPEHPNYTDTVDGHQQGHYLYTHISLRPDIGSLALDLNHE